MTINYTQLKTELNTDPKGYGYVTSWSAGDDVTTASLLDQVRTTEQIAQDRLMFWQVFNVVNPNEYATVMAGASGNLKQTYFMTLGLSNRIDLTQGNVQAALDLIFPVTGSFVAPTTHSAIHALYTRAGSRAETLFGAGTTLSAADVGAARNA